MSDFKFIAVVTAAQAAEAMGGFSRPRWGRLEEEAMQSSLEEFGESLRAMGDESSPSAIARVYAQARERVAEISAARECGLWWTHTNSAGSRLIKTDGPEKLVVEDSPANGWYWKGYEPGLVFHAEYRSATSKSALVWYRTRDGLGTLEFVPPRDNPGHRGMYYEAWCRAAGIDPNGPEPEPDVYDKYAAYEEPWLAVGSR
jgi:hypothetical protein